MLVCGGPTFIPVIPIKTPKLTEIESYLPPSEEARSEAWSHSIWVHWIAFFWPDNRLPLSEATLCQLWMYLGGGGGHTRSLGKKERDGRRTVPKIEKTICANVNYNKPQECRNMSSFRSHLQHCKYNKKIVLVFRFMEQMATTVKEMLENWNKSAAFGLFCIRQSSTVVSFLCFHSVVLH